MKLFEEFKEYENMWEALSENIKIDDNEALKNKFIDIILSIKDRSDFVKKAQEIYDCLPADIGFRILYPNSGFKTLVKLPDGSLSVHTRTKADHSDTTITEPKNAVAALQASANERGAAIVTTARHELNGSYSFSLRGAKVVNHDGSAGMIVLNRIIPIIKNN